MLGLETISVIFFFSASCWSWEHHLWLAKGYKYVFIWWKGCCHIFVHHYSVWLCCVFFGCSFVVQWYMANVIVIVVRWSFILPSVLLLKVCLCTADTYLWSFAFLYCFQIEIDAIFQLNPELLPPAARSSPEVDKSFNLMKFFSYFVFVWISCFSTSVLWFLLELNQ